MPRTKLAKVTGSKRARENISEVDDIIRDFDVEFENSIQLIRAAHQKNLEDVENEIESFKSELGPVILKTMSDLKKMTSLTESAEKSIHELNMTLKENIQSNDEGYLTGGVKYKTSDSECDKMSQKSANVSIIAPLKTLKSRRRSQSASNIHISTSTPGPRSMMNQMKLKTPLSNVHSSRSKFKSATKQPLQRAASADRVESIVPKVNPMTPVSILRHPKAGEMAFSVSGSPIVTSSVIEKTANVNIPIANGAILSVRPENMDPSHLNASLIRKIDNSTILHLHTLKNNLDILMKAFESKMGS